METEIEIKDGRETEGGDKGAPVISMNSFK
jgi:hypothetical protein